MNIYIIITIVAVLLLIIGATQRKALTTWIRSEAKSVIDNSTNTIKVANLRLSDLKKQVIKLAETAATLYAQEIKQEKQIKKLTEDSEDLLSKAKTAKDNNEAIKSKEYLKLKIETDNQLAILEENVEILKSKRATLELNIQKIKTYIQKSKIQLSGLKARKDTNSLLKDIKVTTIDGNTLEETIDNVEEKVSTDELKLSYLTEDEVIEDSYSETLETEFNKL